MNEQQQSSAPHKPEPVAATTEDGTPSKPRQAGSGNGRKQPRAAKQLRFEGAAAASTPTSTTTSAPATADAEAQADLAAPADEQEAVVPPQLPQASSPQPRSLSRPATEAAHTPMPSGSDVSQPKRRKRTTTAKHRSSASGYVPQSGYYYTAEAQGPAPKGRSKAAHRAPKQDDKGPCLNPACRTTDTPQWRLGPMFCRELCNRCGTRWQRAKNTRNPQGFFVWVRNDLRAQGLEVPDAVARPAASPDLAMQALREVENQPHAGRQHNNKAEEVEISEDDEVPERGSGRRFEDDGLEDPDEESDVSAPEVVPHHRSAMRAPNHRLKQPRSYPPHQPTVFYDPPLHPMHHKAHRGSHSKVPYVDHYEEAAMRMAQYEGDAQPNEVQEDDSGASEADLLCSEVLSESHDEGSDIDSYGLYRRRYSSHAPQRYYEDESEVSEEEEDQEVAVTKRGRAVKLPAKYKAETDKHQRKRKAEDSPEGGSRGRMQRPYPHALDWAHRPVPVSNYDMAQRAQHGRAGHYGLGSPNGKSRSLHSHKAAKHSTADGRSRDGAYPSPSSHHRSHLGFTHTQAHQASYPSAQLDEADTEAVDALMGMTGMLYAH